MKSKVIFNEDYLLKWEIIVKAIISSHHRNGYKRIFLLNSSNLDDDILNQNIEKVDYLDSLKLFSYAKFNDKVDAKSEILNLLSSFANIVEEISSLSLIEGYYNGNEDIVIGGIYLKDKFIVLFKAYIVEVNGLFCSKIEYYHQIIDVIEFYQLEFGACNSLISLNKYGGVVLESNSIETKKMIEQIKCHYEIDFADCVERTKDKYQYLENKGYNFIFEFRKNARLKVKCPLLNVYQEVLDIDVFIKNMEMEIDKKVKQMFFAKTYMDLKEKTMGVCFDCVQHIGNGNYLKLFNQRISRNCCRCHKVANVNILLIG